MQLMVHLRNEVLHAAAVYRILEHNMQDQEVNPAKGTHTQTDKPVVLGVSTDADVGLLDEDALSEKAARNGGLHCALGVDMFSPCNP